MKPKLEKDHGSKKNCLRDCFNIDPDSCKLTSSETHFKHLEGHSGNQNHKDQLASCECLNGFYPFQEGVA